MIDPQALIDEIAQLKKQGIVVTPATLRIAENATLILPLHRELEALREAEDAATRIGTTKRGIGPAYEDKVGRRAIRFMDLADLAGVARKDRSVAGASQCACAAAMAFPRSSAKAVYDHLAAIAPKVLPFMDSVWSLLDGKRREGKRILFEGAQGALLDIDHGTYPYVTSSNTVAAQAATGSGLGPMRSIMCSASARPTPPALAWGRFRPTRWTMRSGKHWASAEMNSARSPGARAAADGSMRCLSGRPCGHAVSTAWR